MQSQPDTIDVLKEMVRIAENRRKEELEMVDRINRYNLGLIAFAGAFLSILVTANVGKHIVQTSGLFLIVSIVIALITIRPRTLKGGGPLAIDQDIRLLREGKSLPQAEFLLAVADLTDQAGAKANGLAHAKKRWTIYSALFLVLALITTYTLYTYA